MMVKYPHSRILLFTREPLLGQVKTRLYPATGHEQALLLYEAMLRRVASMLEDANLADWDLLVTSNPSHKTFISICNKKNIYLQMEGDLGQKMAAATAQALAREEVQSVLVIGSDCPAMGPDYLNAAIAALEEGNDVVLGPADDGGYVLLGLRRVIPELFAGIPWGSSEVLKASLRQLDRLKVPYQLLETLWDVDRAEDLRRLQELDPPLDWVDMRKRKDD